MGRSRREIGKRKRDLIREANLIITKSMLNTCVQ